MTGHDARPAPANGAAASAERVAALRDELLTAHDKGIPERAIGLTVAEFLATEPRLSEFWTPLIALDDSAIAHNIALLADWTAARGLQLMPHGKTTMAPALWQRQLEAGSLGITLATMGQVRTARDVGVASIMLANAAVDERSLRYLAGELADPGFRFVCWADSLATVEAMERGLRAAGAPRRVDVCVELGAAGGRTGARSTAEAVALGERIAASDVLRLAGAAGYEGSLGHDRSLAALGAVRRYLEAQLELHAALRPLYDDGEIYVTAGGSAYFDVVADVWRDAVAAEPGTLWTLRSGAYVVHDDGFYRGISPLDGGAPAGAAGPAGGPLDPAARLRPAMTGLARVVSRPEPGLALLDGGKRDFPFDEGLPNPRATAAELGEPWSALAGAQITQMNDQHSYLAVAPGAAPLGSVVALGLSHPCTSFDKWHYLPVVAGPDSDRVVDLIRTFF
jgi:D-serine deaminase-like pyridoxal phosphate-dependent protein